MLTEVRDRTKIVREAARLLRKRDAATARLREIDEALRPLQQEYNRATGVYGAGLDHLRRDCAARGLIEHQ